MNSIGFSGPRQVTDSRLGYVANSLFTAPQRPASLPWRAGSVDTRSSQSACISNSMGLIFPIVERLAFNIVEVFDVIQHFSLGLVLRRLRGGASRPDTAPCESQTFVVDTAMKIPQARRAAALRSAPVCASVSRKRPIANAPAAQNGRGRIGALRPARPDIAPRLLAPGLAVLRREW
jgi:hypothetical protein